MTDYIPPNIHHVGDVSSTMDLAREMITDMNSAPFAVLAESQSKGRGTTGRQWVSPKGNMYLSVCIPEGIIQKEILPVLPLLSGLAGRAAILDLLEGANIYVKWPNDIIYDSKKIGGSIVENEKEYLLIGMGLNIEIAPPVTDEGRTPTTLNDISITLGKPKITPKQLAEAVWFHVFKFLLDKTLTREKIVHMFDMNMDKNLTLHRRTLTGRDPEPLRAVRLNEWGHLVVMKSNGEEDTLVAEYLF